MENLFIYEDEEDPNTLNETEMETMESNEEKLKKLLINKKIFVEVFNDGTDCSSIFKDILLKYGAVVRPALARDLDYIIFKEGKARILKYAKENNLKMVNVLWLDDKKNGIYKPDEEYLIKLSNDEINLICQLETIKPKTKKPKKPKIPYNFTIDKKKMQKTKIFSNTKIEGNKKVDDFFKILSKNSDDESTNKDLKDTIIPFESNNIDEYYEQQNLGLPAIREENSKIFITSYSITEDKINFLKGIKHFEYEEMMIDDNFIEKDSKNLPKYIFIPNIFNQYDSKIISWIFQGKSLVNVSNFINEVGMIDDKDLNDNIIQNALNISTLDNSQYIKKIPSNFNYAFCLGKNMTELERIICNKILNNVFDKVVYHSTETSSIYSKFNNKLKIYLIDKPNIIQNAENSIVNPFIMLNSGGKSFQSDSNKKYDESFFEGKLNLNYVYDSFYNKCLLEINDEILRKYAL